MLFVILHARGQRPAPTRGDSMDKLVIEGGVPLTGGIDISGSKNAALPILFASILLSEPAVIANVPDLRDIHTTLKLLNVLGCACGYDDHEVRTQPGQLLPEAPYDLVRTMRASVLCLGPLLARPVWLCPAAAPSARAPWTSTSRGWKAWAPAFSWKKATFLAAAAVSRARALPLTCPP